MWYDKEKNAKTFFGNDGETMFKNTFVKYVIAFSVIILTSFLILSMIITLMIRAYATDEKKNSLISTSMVVSRRIEDKNVSDLRTYIETNLPKIEVSTMAERDPDIDIILTDPYGVVLLTTVIAEGGDESDEPRMYPNDGDLGTVDLSLFSESESDRDGLFLVAQGTLDGLLKETHLIYACPIRSDEGFCGYSLALTSMANEDNLIVTTRRAVINSSLWVMLAAVIAVYFITERIIQPMRSMTLATKSFAQNDFSTRVPVYGKDEISQLAVAFNNMAQSLENYDKMRNSFLAAVSHDLRTPMTTIAGFIDGINSGAIPEEKRQYYLGVISAEVHRLSRLVSELLDVSRLQSGERKFNVTDFDVAEVSRLILISFEQRIDEKKLNVVFDTEEDAMIANADKDAIYQVIYNLCHNAIKFAKEGGRFEIKIRRAENRKLLVSVFDEGATIDKEEAPFVFQQFYKIDKSRGLDKKGVGLGLYICKTIIDAHGESIRLNTERTDGCEFLFTLKEGTASPRKKPRNPAEIGK